MTLAVGMKTYKIDDVEGGVERGERGCMYVKCIPTSPCVRMHLDLTLDSTYQQQRKQQQQVCEAPCSHCRFDDVVLVDVSIERVCVVGSWELGGICELVCSEGT